MSFFFFFFFFTVALSFVPNVVVFVTVGCFTVNVFDRFESWLALAFDTIEIKGLNENGLFPDLESALSAKIPHESWVDLSPVYTYLVRGTNLKI